MNIKIEILSFPKQNEYEELINILEPSTIQEYDDFYIFWKNWFSGRISGNKVTIVARTEYKIVGIVRFWDSPYFKNKWFIEGLYVLPDFRKKGISEKMLTFGLQQLKSKFTQEVYVHIKNKNYPSKKLFNKLRFLINEDYNHLDSYGIEDLFSSEYKIDISIVKS